MIWVLSGTGGSGGSDAGEMVIGDSGPGIRSS